MRRWTLGAAVSATLWIACGTASGVRTGDGVSSDAGAVDAADAPPSCGDAVCAASESCTTCARDCGECPKCDYAPSCTGAAGAPASPTERLDLCQPPTDAGAPPTPITTRCGDAQLRLRIQKIHVYEGGGTLYCIIDANDGKSAEVALTAKTGNLDNDSENFFQVGQATFWGQKELHATVDNLVVTYNCYRVKNDAWANALKAAGDTSAQIGGESVGPYGWAFSVAGIAANAAAAAVATANQNDDLVFNAQQVLARQDLLDLTNGRAWTIRKGDPGGIFDVGAWDWEITVEAWGCADGTPLPR